MSDLALTFRDVSMTFPDGTAALESANLTVARGELVGIVGPSGCGKSTLLRIAAGLLKQSAGVAEVGAGPVSYVFQSPTLLPWRTVQRNVELLAELNRVTSTERREDARRAIDLVGLSGFESHYPASLSGGMQMRVSLARALVRQPSLFLFDEPFAAVDEITRQRLQSELLELFSSENFAGLFVTHSISEATFLCSRVAVMSSRPGRIAEVFDVPFPYPRNADLRFDAAFGSFCGSVSKAQLAHHSD